MLRGCYKIRGVNNNMNYVKLIAPAKVNLVLAVGKTRSDGFHEVDTIMHALALHDVLEMYHYDAEEEGSGLVIRLTSELDEGVMLDVAPEQNIIYRALVMLAQELGRTEDEEIRITLIKHIPSEAGLGGGSSNAAAALYGAALMWGIAPDDARLLDVAKRLGADVAFFLQGGCAYLNGKGDELVKSLAPRKDFCVLIRPHVGISTKAAYEAFDANPVEVSDKYRQDLALLEAADEVELWNNMALASESLCSELRVLRAWLDSIPEGKQAVLCGSGSAVCVLCNTYDEAVAVSVAAQRKGYWTRVSSLSRLGVSVIESF